jgi:nucleotide-binding universal stress UspA family protein
MLPLATILHPSDFSEHSEFAFRLACALARDYKARLVLLHVLPPPIILYGGGAVPPDPWPTIEEAKAKLRELEGRAHHVCVESQVMEGDPVDMILRAAGETHCDVIVMGTHGRTALTRLLLGSVAESVIRKAPCPVLTAKHVTARKIAVAEGEAKAEAGIAVGTPAE